MGTSRLTEPAASIRERGTAGTAVPRPADDAPPPGPSRLRFLACGSVDDGKSTLIGRLLHDTRAIPEDHLAAVARDSARFGTTGAGEIDLALVTDGLRAEREQGITIDVAYRQFSTARRRFLVVDTPGHEQYTRNMVTGASTCEAAVILVDARYGVQTQTRRHSYIVGLLGIRHVIVAVNKMDLVLYSKSAFEKIQSDYLEFAAGLGIPDVRFVPVSALTGANVVEPSDAMRWYVGPTLLGQLEALSADDSPESADLRLPVQYVIRPRADFRGMAGTIAGGRVGRGDEVLALPSGLRSRIRSIVVHGGQIECAVAPMAVAVTLEDPIDVSRGDMLVTPRRPPAVATAVEAELVWMAETPLVLGQEYWIKHTTRIVPGRFVELRYRTDVDTLARHPAAQLRLNEIGRVLLALSQPIACDPYAANRATGAFIVIDRVTNQTVGAGMIHEAMERRSTDARTHDPITVGRPRPPGSVSRAEREARLGQKGVTVLLSGRQATTVAYRLERRLFEAGRVVAVLDGAARQPPDVREAHRDLSTQRRQTARLAGMLSEAGLICVWAVEPGDDAAGDPSRTVATPRGVSVRLVHALDALEDAAPDLTLSTVEPSVESDLDRLLRELRERGIWRELP